MLSLCGQTFQPVWTDFAGGVTRTAHWRKTVNVMGEIPVLEIGNEKLSQTALILLRLASDHDQFCGRTEEERNTILRWLFWDNHKLTSYMATYRFQRAFLPSAEPAVLDFLRDRIDGSFSILDRHFERHDYVAGDRATVADISMLGYLCFPVEESGYEIDVHFPAVSCWIDRMRQLRGWQPPYALLPGKRMPVNDPLN